MNPSAISSERVALPSSAEEERLPSGLAKVRWVASQVFSWVQGLWTSAHFVFFRCLSSLHPKLGPFLESLTLRVETLWLRIKARWQERTAAQQLAGLEQRTRQLQIEKDLLEQRLTQSNQRGFELRQEALRLQRQHVQDAQSLSSYSREIEQACAVYQSLLRSQNMILSQKEAVVREKERLLQQVAEQQEYIRGIESERVSLLRQNAGIGASLMTQIVAVEVLQKEVNLLEGEKIYQEYREQFSQEPLPNPEDTPSSWRAFLVGVAQKERQYISLLEERRNMFSPDSAECTALVSLIGLARAKQEHFQSTCQNVLLAEQLRTYLQTPLGPLA